MMIARETEVALTLRIEVKELPGYAVSAAILVVGFSGSG